MSVGGPLAALISLPGRPSVRPVQNIEVRATSIPLLGILYGLFNIFNINLDAVNYFKGENHIWPSSAIADQKIIKNKLGTTVIFPCMDKAQYSQAYFL